MIFGFICGYDEKFVIVGHHPCFRIGPEYGNNIFRSKYYIDIDTGAGHKEEGGRLSCYSIEEDKSIYLI